MSHRVEIKRAGETRNLAVYLGSRLLIDELITGTPAVVEVTTADLNISDIGLNIVEPVIGGRFPVASRAVTFTVAGGLAGNLYTIRITAVTDEGQTIIESVSLRVN